ncbi:MAG TPA: plastocyanin/azurin family copper-binding protein [Thermoanaerobaculia bacterium]
MFGVSRRWLSRIIGIASVLAVAAITVSGLKAERGPKIHNQVIIPGEDRFVPFALTISAGDFVKWTNTDTDDHTVVSNDFFNTAGNQGTNIVIPGTDSNNGSPGTLILHFSKPGTFVYYCRFHAHLDADHQPAAPGPDGGIQDPNGNFGTPMNGIITVLPGGQGGD